jgi:exodeoxyribonuclease V alpha subunit
MVLRNDYQQRLYNGDVGIVRSEPGAGGELRAFFMAQEPLVRRIAPVKLPEHETVYAMTVHKSQGSEFERVVLVLPPFPSPVLTRELVYTAVTRARRSVEIWADEKILAQAVANPIMRTSGLRDALWEQS